ncbi:hypothetical protein B0H14DRAFT_3452779 [Mycena olivaceomarginata]|nr:hypothetical protein B0H14DRAFT_3452779 [Mycena olivaceomarginata]
MFDSDHTPPLQSALRARLLPRLPRTIWTRSTQTTVYAPAHSHCRPHLRTFSEGTSPSRKHRGGIVSPSLGWPWRVVSTYALLDVSLRPPRQEARGYDSIWLSPPPPLWLCTWSSEFYLATHPCDRSRLCAARLAAPSCPLVCRKLSKFLRRCLRSHGPSHSTLITLPSPCLHPRIWSAQPQGHFLLPPRPTTWCVFPTDAGLARRRAPNSLAPTTQGINAPGLFDAHTTYPRMRSWLAPNITSPRPALPVCAQGRPPPRLPVSPNGLHEPPRACYARHHEHRRQPPLLRSSVDSTRAPGTGPNSLLALTTRALGCADLTTHDACGYQTRAVARPDSTLEGVTS